jgi:hypothetical protein
MNRNQENSNLVSVQYHRRQANNPNLWRFYCPCGCNRWFRSAGERQTHQERCFVRPKFCLASYGYDFSCKILNCTRVFKTQWSLARHFRSVHDLDLVEYVVNEIRTRMGWISSIPVPAADEVAEITNIIEDLGGGLEKEV